MRAACTGRAPGPRGHPTAAPGHKVTPSNKHVPGWWHRLVLAAGGEHEAGGVEGHRGDVGGVAPQGLGAPGLPGEGGKCGGVGAAPT